MALYRFEVKVIGRARGASGQSAVATAAYRAGQSLAKAAAAYRSGSRVGQADYSEKRHVVHSEIMAPPGTPSWAFDREMLWNEVERRENRKNSRFARELLVSLPRDLSLAQNRALVRSFVAAELLCKGMIADVNIHSPRASDGGANPHAHIMVTVRRLNADGWAKTKDRSWDRTEMLEHWRQSWAEHVNRALRDAGSFERVDHRSLEARGIDRTPQPKLGPAVASMERSGKTTRKGEAFRLARFAELARHITPTDALDPVELYRLHKAHQERLNALG